MPAKWLLLNTLIAALVGAAVAIAVINSDLPLNARRPAAVPTLLPTAAPKSSAVPTSVIVAKIKSVADKLDAYAADTDITGVRYATHASALAAANELRAQAEVDPTPQAQAALTLLPEVEAALNFQKFDGLALNRLAVRLRAIK